MFCDKSIEVAVFVLSLSLNKLSNKELSNV